MSDHDRGPIFHRIPNLARLVSGTPHWMVEKKDFPVFEELKGGELQQRGLVSMSIAFQIMDEREFAMGWFPEPTVDDNLQEYTPVLFQQTPPQMMTTVSSTFSLSLEMQKCCGEKIRKSDWTGSQMQTAL